MSDFTIKRIETRALRAADIPLRQREWLPHDGDGDDWKVIKFALSFDGYELLEFNDLMELCDLVKDIFARAPAVLKTFNTSGLRMLLFFEQRRARATDVSLVDDYTNHLLDAIRGRLSR